MPASSGWRSRWASSVVLPAPRKPISTVTGVISAMRVAVPVQVAPARPAARRSPPARRRAPRGRSTTRRPVWQATPSCSTSSSSVSPSQSTRSSRRCCAWPEVSPLRHNRVAAAAEVADPAGGERLGHRLAVHPGEHQHLAGVVLLGDGGHQAAAHRSIAPPGWRRRGLALWHLRSWVLT